MVEKWVQNCGGIRTRTPNPACRLRFANLCRLPSCSREDSLACMAPPERNRQVAVECQHRRLGSFSSLSLRRKLLQHLPQFLIELARLLEHRIVTDLVDRDRVVVGVFLVDGDGSRREERKPAPG